MRTLALAALAVALSLPAQAQDPTEVPAEQPVAGPSIVDVLEADGRFATLLGALDTAGLRATLGEPGPYTVFAPTDSAFAALPEGALASLSPEDLQDVLLRHVVLGAAPAAEAVAAGTVSSAWGDQSLSVVAGDDGVVRVDGVAVIDPDLEASNGVVHVIDGVLLPPAEGDVDDMGDGDMDDDDMDGM
ncbi:fasciclin domain-containing protein [Rubrivirga sp.]|uniref:fasciclin domain-containing protein n=1 Tax=Rubrivirga sp. TaxID=1885344 RepID=UPI003B5209E0